MSWLTRYLVYMRWYYAMYQSRKSSPKIVTFVQWLKKLRNKIFAFVGGYLILKVPT